MNSRSCIYYIDVLVVFFSLSCEELLPPRSEPEEILNVTGNFPSGTFTFRELPGAPGQYEANPLVVNVTVRNVFDEVLQDSIYVRGKVETWDRNRAGKRATLDLRLARVIPSWITSAGVLTLEPNGFVGLDVVWGHYTDTAAGGRSSPIWEGIRLTEHSMLAANCTTNREGYFLVEKRPCKCSRMLENRKLRR